MHLIQQNGLPLLQFELFNRYPETVHAVTTRRGGCSSGPYESLNVGFNVGDINEHVSANQQTVLAALGYDYDGLVTARQVHKTTVNVVTEETSSEDSGSVLRVPEADGLVTEEPGLLLMIKVADCFPVFLYDPVRRVIGLLHAGWRGTAQGIIENGIEIMAARFGCSPKNLVAGVGPGISKCCFEVDEEVLEGFRGTFQASHALWELVDRKKYLFDLKQAIVQKLTCCGLAAEAVAVAGQCTACCADLLFSHRRDRGNTGRMAALLGLRR